MLAGDRPGRERESLAHFEWSIALRTHARRGFEIVVHIDADEHVRLELARDYGAAEAADLLVRSDGEEHAGVFQRRCLGDEFCQLRAHETAEPVVEVGTVETVLAEAAADRAVEQDRIAGADAKLLDLLLAILPVEL